MTGSVVDDLQRIARLDGYTVRVANGKPQAKRWGGRLAITEGEAFHFASDDPLAIRGWLHTHVRS